MIATGIVRLRGGRADLLGYPTYAHRRMADTMALGPKAAQALLTQVRPVAVARVKQEFAELLAIAAKGGLTTASNRGITLFATPGFL